MNYRARGLLTTFVAIMVCAAMLTGCGGATVRTHPSMQRRVQNVAQQLDREEPASPTLSELAMESECLLGNLESALMLQGTVSLVAPELEQSIQQVVLKLASAADLPMSPRVLLVNMPLSNAWSCPNGDIIVTSGLLTLVDNRDELAVALAHEVAHLRYHHGYSKLLDAFSKKKTTERIAAILIGTASGAASAVSGSLPGYVPLSEPFSAALFNEIAGRVLSDIGGRIVVHAGVILANAALAAQLSDYSQEQELAADRAAIRYATLAGFDPKKGSMVFEKLRKLESQSRKGSTAGR